jgi:glycosyltransferase involved in cell wall biosynthesis
MKKILFITAFPPNNQTAGQNYSKNLVKDLSEKYRVDIIGFEYENHEFYDFDSNNIEYIMKVKNGFWNKITGILKMPIFFPIFTVRFSYKVLYYIIKNRFEYDYFYFDFSQVFIYSIFLKKEKKFLMSHDVMIQKYSRLKTNKIISIIINLWVYTSENKMIKGNNKSVLCFSDKDCSILKEKYGCESKKVDFYIEENIKQIEINEIDDYYCFYGAWGRKENLESLEWFEKNIESKLNINIKIIGGGIKEEYKKILSAKGFEVLGFVDNPYEILSRSRGLIAPLFNGAGVKVKVVEALACGVPVIGTEIALEGIELKNKFIKKIDSYLEILEAIEELKNLELKDKNDLKEFFNKNYGKNKFIRLIQGENE